VKVPAAARHAEAADFDFQIGKGGQFAHVSFPDGKDFIAFALIGTDTEDAANMIKDHAGF